MMRVDKCYGNPISLLVAIIQRVIRCLPSLSLISIMMDGRKCLQVVRYMMPQRVCFFARRMATKVTLEERGNHTVHINRQQRICSVMLLWN